MPLAEAELTRECVNSYDALKAQIYKFEKQAVLQQAATGPATSYRDEPSDLEAGAAAGPVDKIKKENEKTFIKLLDKELHKITEFYVAKGAPAVASSVVWRGVAKANSTWGQTPRRTRTPRRPCLAAGGS